MKIIQHYFIISHKMMELEAITSSLFLSIDLPMWSYI